MSSDDEDVMVVDENEPANDTASIKRSYIGSEDDKTPAKKRKTGEPPKKVKKQSTGTPTSKDNKAREREEKKRQQEEEKARKQEERAEAKRQRDDEKREKERIKAESKQRKEEEKRRKEEERTQKAAERQTKKEVEDRIKQEKRAAVEEKRQEKLRAEEEKEAEKRRLAKALLQFVVPVQQTTRNTLSWSTELFKPFELRDNVKMPPSLRRQPLTETEYKSVLNVSVQNSDYLSRMAARKKMKHAPKDKMRGKLFQFHSSYRPPYYGTWRKVSTVITGRRPFAQSPDEVDYDNDSEADWEEQQAEEAAGEDCCDSEGEDNPRDEVDSDSNDFYVGHGYLSDTEESDDGGEVKKSAAGQRRAGEYKKQRCDKTRRGRKQLKPKIYGLNWSRDQLPAASKLSKSLKTDKKKQKKKRQAVQKKKVKKQTQTKNKKPKDSSIQEPILSVPKKMSRIYKMVLWLPE